ncbi:hypothetical protein MFMK1_001126 [Metallumcola ferriviriculae]|uniref:Methionine synthase n=1 Tax=Metallumcola ferriviriculae TaxID=3039180 RepID=A0AAU0UJ28_9FIRM|nr:hypothetical protein MFMK1_001126 [Desulfitibacteraceae bacterium MK1]
MTLTGNLATTAMGILPHKDVATAQKLALTLDIPFWPQLPRVDFYEDMYVQASEDFPGIVLDTEEQRISFRMEKFYAELPDFIMAWEEGKTLTLSEDYSVAYHNFLKHDLEDFQAIRGQIIGPVSFGLKIADETKTPIIYHDEVRQLLYDMMARKIQTQYHELKSKNDNAFVWVDEPGLEMIFMAITGYSSEQAVKDYRKFLSELPGPKGVHLCGNPDWSFLLNLGLDILSIDVLQWGNVFTSYRDELTKFIKDGGIISWGITPTLTEEVAENNVEKLCTHLERLWDNATAKTDLTLEEIISRSWLAPARCCLINSDGTQSVDRSFDMLKEISAKLKTKYVK